MGWRLDKDKVRRQWEEASRFLEVARGDERAGLEDLVSRPFEPPSGPEEIYPRQALATSVGDEKLETIYLLQSLGHLYESGVLAHGEFLAIRDRILS
jgi:hypothetical protein